MHGNFWRLKSNGTFCYFCLLTTSNFFEMKKTDLVKFFLFSGFGLFVFFVPISLGGKNTIVLDHIINFFRNNFPRASSVYALTVIFAGGVFPFVTQKWKENLTSVVFSILKALGIVVALMYYFRIGPQWLFEKDLTPFLFEKLVIPVGIIVPVGAIFLAFLVDYGLLEFVGTLMQPVMKPVFRTPGRSAIDALASFVGSYSIALLITNRVYKDGKYTVKEAVIIATGFSTVSATFMIIVAKTTGLMEMWNFYFWSTLIITFVVTAITVRIPPLSKKEDSATEEINKEKTETSRLAKALDDGLTAFRSAPPLQQTVLKNLKDGLLMAMSILPSIMSVGLIGLLLSKYTPVFDYLGYLFYPFVKIFGVPDSLLISKAAALEISEMFLPSLLISGASLIARYVVAVVSVSAILFFSASIPCILATEIPISIGEIIIIWFERTLLALIIALAFALLFL